MGESVDDVASHPSAIAGIQAMADQHGILVDTLNSLRHQLAQGEDRVRVNEQITRLVEFTGMHFGCEESLLRRYGFPGLADHRSAHQELMDQMRQAAGSAEYVDSRELDRVLAFVRGQYLEHIEQFDQQYNEWLNKKGVF
jgi:hemerythrin